MANCETKKQSYLATFGKSVYLLFALLFTSVAMTVVLLNYKYGAFGKLVANKPLFTFLLVVVAIVAVAVLAYLILSIKSNKISFADAIGNSALLIGVALLLYLCMRNGGFSFKLSVKAALVCILLIVVGVAFLVARICKFGEGKEDAISTKKTVCNYYKTLVKKYSIVSVAITGLVMACASYLVTNFNFRWSVIITLKGVPALGLIFVIAIALTGLWVATSISQKKVNVFDVALLAAVLPLITTLVQILAMSNGNVKLFILWLAILAVYLFLTYIRYLSFDLTAETKVDGKCYLKKVIGENGLLFNLSAASLSVAFIGLVLETNLLTTLLPRNAAGRIVPAITFFPVAVITLAIVMVFLVGLILSITTLYNKKKIMLGDHFLVLFAMTSLFLVLLVFTTSSLYQIAIFMGLALLAITLVVSRIRKYND
ncbi:MAG: hypothetical protein E7369_02130 [Clostridiales bacterium]|nr:hypothetical protein [Clostridiales bacterium]